MLEKAEYMGHTVNFRSSKKSYRDKRVKNDPSDWLIFENTHEAIVDPETWKLAQQVKRTVRRTDTTGVANPLTGLVFCADCGAKMYNHRGKRRAMNGYPNILKAPNMAGKISSQNAGTATSSLFCGGLHVRMWQTAICSAPGTKNASTTAAMPNVVCWSGLRFMRAWLPEPWRKRVSSLNGAS